MMQNTFVRRLIYYLIGFSLGLVLVFFFYGNRGCSWLPENKVKDTIKKKFVISMSPKVNAFDFVKLLDNAEVVFNKSDKNTNNKSYQFKLKQTENNLKEFYITYNSDSYFAVFHEKKDALKNVRNDTLLKIISVPNDTDGLINFDNIKKMQIIFEKFNFTSNSYGNTLLKNGYLNYNSLKPNNPEAVISLKDKSDTLKIFLLWRDLVLIPHRVEN